MRGPLALSFIYLNPNPGTAYRSPSSGGTACSDSSGKQPIPLFDKCQVNWRNDVLALLEIDRYEISFLDCNFYSSISTSLWQNSGK
jgi:hypothetical protein